MDVYCKKCGEPWDFGGVLPALKGREDEADMTKEEAEKLMRGEGCPSCGFGKYCPLCKGSGEISEDEARWWDDVEPVREEDGVLYYKCPKCDGTGKPRGGESDYYAGLVEADGEVDVVDYLM